MAKKIYVTEPKIVAPTGTEETPVCYSVYEWEEGQVGILHPPCADEGRISLTWGDGIVEARQKVIDTVSAHFPGVSSNDIIFLGGWN